LRHVVAGKAKLLAVLGRERRPDFPDVPLLREIYPALDLRVWFGIFAPLGMPQSIIAAMSYAMNKVAGDRELRQKQTLCAIAMAPNPGTPEALAALVRDDYQKYGAYIRQFNISSQ